MRIVTWNVNGFRAGLRKGIWRWVEEQVPDVFCLQEIKVKPPQLTEEQKKVLAGGYTHLYYNPAERAGYSGVATFTNMDVMEVSFGLGDDRFDIEGRVIRMRFPDFILFNVYFPNGGRDLSRLRYKLDFYARLLEICDRLHDNGECVIICGDFNTAHREIDLRNPKQNERTSGFLPEERVWIDRYLDHGFVDVYRALYPDSVAYTWWTYRFSARERNIGWRLDYFMVSEALLASVKDSVIHNEIQGSDHCPVSLMLAP